MYFLNSIHLPIDLYYNLFNTLVGILRIGDYVTFKNIKHNSLLCAEGILLEDLIVDEHVKVLDDCLFCIHLQRQYSAARELEEFLASNKDEGLQDANAAKYYQALRVSISFFTRLLTINLIYIALNSIVYIWFELSSEDLIMRIN